MPWRDAPPIPPKNVSGTESTSAHGQLTTKKVSARSTHVGSAATKSGEKIGGTSATATARYTTTGVYTRAKRLMKFSERDLLRLAFCTRSMILLAVDSPKPLVTRTRRSPVRFTQPDATSSPTPASRGTLSPVRATVSRLVWPSITTPSSAIFSPGRTTMTSPTATSPGSVATTSPSRSTYATSGRICISSRMERRELSSAMPSNSSPTWKKSITNTASANCGSPPGTKPMSSAPSVATDMRKSSSNGRRAATDSAASRRTPRPATR